MESSKKIRKEPRACGSWISVIKPENVANAVEVFASGLMFEPQTDGQFLYFLSLRADEGGRNAIFRWRPGGEPECILPPPWSARTRVPAKADAGPGHRGGAVFLWSNLRLRTGRRHETLRTREHRNLRTQAGIQSNETSATFYIS
jgi:hypothetical protein